MQPNQQCHYVISEPWNKSSSLQIHLQAYIISLCPSFAAPIKHRHAAGLQHYRSMKFGISRPKLVVITLYLSVLNSVVTLQFLTVHTKFTVLSY